MRLVTGASLSGLRLPAGADATQAAGPPTPGQPGAAPTPPQPSGPVGRIVWEEGGDSHDFGNLVQGESRDHTFEVSNEGEGDLVVSDIRSTCGCTVATSMVQDDAGEWVAYQKGAPIAPGKKLRVPTTLNTKDKQGRMNTAVNLMSNDPRQIVSLRLTAEITPVVAVEPMHVNLMEMMTNETREAVINVSSTVVDAFALSLQEDILGEGISVELVPIDPGPDGRSNKWEVHATVGPNVPEGTRNFPLRLVTDVEKGEVELPPGHDAADGHDHAAPAAAPGQKLYHEAIAYVIAQVKGMVTANPYYVSFALVRPGQVVTRSFRVECHDPEFEFAKPEVTIRGYEGEFEYRDLIEVAVRPITDQKAYDLEVKLLGLPEDLNGSFRGILEVHVGHPTKEKLEIPFSGVCRGGVGAPLPVQPQNPGQAPNPGQDPGPAPGGPSDPAGGGGE
jgi:hypothetical protein